jgi:hypothetical protein
MDYTHLSIASAALLAIDTNGLPLQSIFELLLFLAAVPLLVVVQVYLLVLKMSEPEKMMRPLTGGLTAYEQQVLANHREWLASCNLQYLTSFQFGSIRVAVFQQQGAQRFFSFYFHKQLSYSIETYFDDLTSFDTGTSGNIGMFPVRPGNYKQSFPGIRADEAWQRHLEGEDYLRAKFGFQFRPLSQPYQQTLVNVMRLHMRHVRSLFLWPFRALYWYAFKRGKMANRSIQMQYP